jgi:hypothetical protein
MMRLNSRKEPSKKIADGKNSEIDGGWNSPLAPEALSSPIVAMVDRANSRVHGLVAGYLAGTRRWTGPSWIRGILTHTVASRRLDLDRTIAT